MTMKSKYDGRCIYVSNACHAKSEETATTNKKRKLTVKLSDSDRLVVCLEEATNKKMYAISGNGVSLTSKC